MLFIDGKWCDAESGATFASHDPATGVEIGRAADGGVADVRAAVEAADAAFGEWSTRTAYERSAYLYQAYQLMLASLRRHGQVEATEFLSASQAIATRLFDDALEHSC